MALLSLLNSNETAFGLDLSELSLKLVKLKKSGPKILLQSWNEMDLLPDLIVNGEIKNRAKLITAINKLIKTCQGRKLPHREVISVLPEPKTFIKLIEVPSYSEKKDLSRAIEKEMEHHLPLPLNELYLDWQVIKNKFYPENSRLRVLVGASPQTITDQYTDLLERAGLLPLVLEIEAVAIVRSLIKENNSDSNHLAQVIIDLGASRTGLIVYDRGTIQFSLSLPISGLEITKAIARSLDLSFDQAEKIKIVCGLDRKKCRGSLKKILQNQIDELTNRIKSVIDFYRDHFPDSNPIERVLLCGGGAKMINITEVLSEKLNLKVEHGNPLTNLTPGKNFPWTQKQSLPFATAIGLALRGLNSK